MKLKFVLLVMIGILIALESVAAYDEVGIEVSIQREESREYNVVGDSFSYAIDVVNLKEGEVEKEFLVCVNTPNRKECETSKFNISSMMVITFGGFPSREYEFESGGIHSINISSENTLFVKDNNGIFNKEDGDLGYYTEYFDAMPRWQYDLFKTEEDVAQKTLEVSKEIKELNKVLRNLTWFLIALTSLVTIFSLVSIISEREKIEKLKLIFKILIVFFAFTVSVFYLGVLLFISFSLANKPSNVLLTLNIFFIIVDIVMFIFSFLLLKEFFGEKIRK